MATEDLEGADLPTEVYFARAAARRHLTPEQLRAQLRTLADEAHSYSQHLSFEQLRDARTMTFSDAEMAHLDQCKYCSRFMQTVQPTKQETDRFVDKARKVFGTQKARSLGFENLAVEEALPFRGPARSIWAIPASIAAGVLLGGVGILTLYALNPSLGPAPKQMVAQQDTRTPHWSNTVKQCAQASGESQGCQLFADAARYQLQGDSAVAQDLVTHGLERSGVSPPIIVQVKKTLQTKPAPPEELPQAIAEAANVGPDGTLTKASHNTQWLEAARLHLAAGQDSKAYAAVGNYLKEETPKSQATAFLVGFVQPVSTLQPTKGSSTPTDLPKIESTVQPAANVSRNPVEHVLP